MGQKKNNECVFKYIKAASFFEKYCPEINNYKRKISGRSGRGNILEFTPEEKKKIAKGIKKMCVEINHTILEGIKNGSKK